MNHPTRHQHVHRPWSNNRGFTLVELAVVLAVVGMLIGGLLIPLSAQYEARNLSDAQRALQDIREALFGFAVINGKLPCPAAPTIVSGSTGAGTEDCSLGNEGVLPWAALGVPELDPWGHRYTYRVTASFKDAPAPPAVSSFAIDTQGDITITDGSADIATHIPAVVVSHGRNGRGAYLQNGSQISGALGDELENADGDTNFVSHPLSESGSANEFDDFLIWVPPGILMNRMIAAGRLP